MFVQHAQKHMKASLINIYSCVYIYIPCKYKQSKSFMSIYILYTVYRFEHVLTSVDVTRSTSDLPLLDPNIGIYVLLTTRLPKQVRQIRAIIPTYRTSGLFPPKDMQTHPHIYMKWPYFHERCAQC